MHAVGLNRSEVNFRRGTYLDAPVLPAGLGSECSGTVLGTGPGVTGWAPLPCSLRTAPGQFT